MSIQGILFSAPCLCELLKKNEEFMDVGLENKVEGGPGRLFCEVDQASGAWSQGNQASSVSHMECLPWACNFAMSCGTLG